MTFPEFARVFGALALQLRLTDADPTTCEAYFDVLQGLPLEAVRVTARAFATEPERKWFPTTAEWHSAAARAETAQLRTALLEGRAEPWRFECKTCDDSGWEYFECTGDDFCGRARAHAPHRFVRICPCRPNNRTYQRHQRW